MRTKNLGRPPGRPKKADHLAVPTDILRTAAILFMDGGYDAVSIDLIAETVGVTKASIYYYFDSKSDLFVSAIESLLTLIHRETVRILREPKSLLERLTDLTRVRLNVPETRLDFDRLLQEAENQLNPDQREVLRMALNNMAESLIEAFRQAMDAQEIPLGDPTFMAHAYFALLNVAYARNRTGERYFPNVDETTDALIQLFWRGIGLGDQD